MHHKIEREQTKSTPQVCQMNSFLSGPSAAAVPKEIVWNGLDLSKCWSAERPWPRFPGAPRRLSAVLLITALIMAHSSLNPRRSLFIYCVCEHRQGSHSWGLGDLFWFPQSAISLPSSPSGSPHPGAFPWSRDIHTLGMCQAALQAPHSWGRESEGSCVERLHQQSQVIATPLSYSSNKAVGNFPCANDTCGLPSM